MAPELDGVAGGAAPGGGVLDDTIVILGDAPVEPDPPATTRRIFCGVLLNHD